MHVQTQSTRERGLDLGGHGEGVWEADEEEPLVLPDLGFPVARAGAGAALRGILFSASAETR